MQQWNTNITDIDNFIHAALNITKISTNSSEVKVKIKYT